MALIERLKYLSSALNAMMNDTIAGEQVGHWDDAECDGLCLAEDFQHVIDDVELKIKAMEKQGKWISVNERLPDESNYFLVYSPLSQYAEIGVCFFSTHAKQFGWERSSRFITHWQPLPEPPEQEK